MDRDDEQRNRRPEITTAGRRRARPGARHRGGDPGAARPAAAGRALGVRARGRRHHPGRVRAAAALSRPSRSTPSSKPRSRVYLRRIQGQHGGWPLFHGGAFDMSASVKAYFALKMIGDPVDAPHMRAAREGDPGARRRARARNVFTRADARAVRLHPVAQRAGDAGRDHAAAALVSVPSRQDLVLGRTVIVPLLVLQALKPRARNPKGVTIDELFLEPPATLGPVPKAPQQKASWFWFFRGVDVVLRAAEPLFPKAIAAARDRSRAVAWVSERLNGEDGLGAIFPAMANSVMMFDVLGYPEDHPLRAIARQIGREAAGGARARGLLPALRLAGVGHRAHLPRAARGRRRARAGAGAQGSRLAGAEADPRRQGRLGGAAARRAAGRLGVPIRQSALSRCRRHRRGGDGDGSRCRARADAATSMRPWRAPGNGSSACRAATAPGARSTPTTNSTISTTSRSPTTARLLDPPTEDVTARCLSMLAQLGETAQTSPAVAAAIDYLRRTQLAGGELVRPLGHELHLRHLVGAVRAQRRGRRSRRGAEIPQGGRLAGAHPEPGRRLGRGRRELQARLSRLRARRRAPRRRPPGRCSA